ncbi:tRNA pseudouridine synthase A [Phlyctema vagabunda]|uniref:tRNA pseudouridine synthase A n=1 Tax=Phlyctema vagabunda TaxID=108571 RepID=A0ABR4PXS0_9HELO
MRSFFSRPVKLQEIVHFSKSQYHASAFRCASKKSLFNHKEIQRALQLAEMEKKGMMPDYSSWSHQSLIERVTQLENELKRNNGSVVAPEAPKKSWKKPRNERIFDGSKYSTRLIALKLAYLGKRYNGFEHHIGHKKPLPTIEEELWKALNKARLIFPKDTHPLSPGEVNWEGCEYSKCGRTDKGVSAFGQVIGIRVRSNRPLAKRKVNTEYDPFPADDNNTFPREGGVELAAPPLQPSRVHEEAGETVLEDMDYEEAMDFDPIADEIPYASTLNRLLPPDIRILAWCPSPPLDFSARFSCRERRYRYFFTQPAFLPAPHNLDGNTNATVKTGWLDIDAMREAAKLFEGMHDFRNFCKVDASKQLENFDRRIFHTDIVEVKDQSTELSFLNGTEFVPATPMEGAPKIYTFDLHGSAFLWHQVRHMVAVLFLVGQGLEAPSIVSELLDAKKHPCRPLYEMATDTPLVLWDCIFPQENDPERKDAIQWHYVGDERGVGTAKYGNPGLMDDLWRLWKERKVDEMLAGSLMGVVANQGVPVSELTTTERKSKSQKAFDGGDTPRMQGIYIPVLKKERLDKVEVINEKYAVRKGFENAEDLKIQGYRRLNKPKAPIDAVVE